MTGTIKRPVGGFTLVELMVSAGITLVLVGILTSVISGLLTSWNQTRGGLATANYAKFAMDRVTSDLQSAILRADGSVWLAATIQDDQAGSGDSGASMATWDAQGGGVMKPGAAAGSLEVRPNGLGVPLEEQRLEGYRFGMAGMWLRFITHVPDQNKESHPESYSAPCAVAYQIIRYRVHDSSGSEIRYGLFRSEVRPHHGGAVANRTTFSVGYDVFADAYNFPDGTNSGEAEPGGIRRPDRRMLVADNVIDFGVRFWERRPDGSLAVLFPRDETKRGFAATTLPPSPPYPTGPELTESEMEYGFPAVAEILVRVLTDQGAAMIEALETGKGGGRPSVYPTDADWWWGVAMENSRVFTRRVILPAVAM